MSKELNLGLGVCALLLTACLDALGYNIQRRDHCKNNVAPKPRHECFRKYWHLGFFIYTGSLLVGIVVGMHLVNAHCVAPITTTSLIFNVIFARFLVGVRVTKRDIVGTATIILSIMCLLLLTSLAAKDENTIELDTKELRILFSRTPFIIYFSLINTILLLGLVIYFILIARIKLLTKNTNLQIQARNAAILVSVLGGLCASESIILAKSGVTFLGEVYKGNWPFFQPLPALVLFGLFISSLFQLFCLNAGLKLADSVLVGPIYSSVYNIFALFNTLIFLEKYKTYSICSLCLMGISIIILVFGIITLASQLKQDPKILPKLPRMKLTKRVNSGCVRLIS